MRRLVLLTALLCIAATTATADAGHNLFTGQNLLAADGRVARFACHNCHGRDGRGGKEGNVPEIAGAVLRKVTDRRPAYDIAAFEKALRRGVDASGRDLSRTMPRYDLSGADVTLLWDYLQDLPRRQTQGITPDTVRFGVILDPVQPELGNRYLRRFAGEMTKAFPSGAVYGRRIEIIGLIDPVGQANEVIAAIAMPAGRSELTDQLIGLGVPVLFPLASLTGKEDASIQRTFTPTDRDVNGTIAQHVATTTASRIAIAADPARADALAHMIELLIPGAEIWRIEATQTQVIGDPDAIIDLGTGLPETLPSHANLYQLASSPFASSTPLTLGQRYLVIEAPNLIALAIEEGLHPLEAHALLAASILKEVLSRTGRDLTRTRLLTEFNAAVLGRVGLNYGRLPLSGTDYVRIVPLASVE